jgi:uncharacterized protein with HEPN domain
MKEDLVFIEHILESVKAIEEFSFELSIEELHLNRMKRSAIVRELEIIGEASKNISDHLKNKYQKIPWKNISGTRDIIVHKYFGVDLEIVFGIVKNEIPKLKKEILKIKGTFL